jgi:hypothetical protein
MPILNKTDDIEQIPYIGDETTPNAQNVIDHLPVRGPGRKLLATEDTLLIIMEKMVENPASELTQVQIKEIINELLNVLNSRNNVITATIAINASMSNAIAVGNKQLFGLLMPLEWTAADISFLVSNELEGTYYSLYGDDGKEVVVKATADKAIGIDSASLKLAPWPFIKIRSGVEATPVTQTAERQIKLSLKV